MIRYQLQNRISDKKTGFQKVTYLFCYFLFMHILVRPDNADLFCNPSQDRRQDSGIGTEKEKHYNG